MAGNRRAEATPSFGRQCPAMTKKAREDNMTATANHETPKDASASVVAQHAAMLNALPFSDTRDFDEASRGFLGTLEQARIESAQGRVVWSLEPYGFLSEEKARAAVHPSLWRQLRLKHDHRPVQ